MSKRQEHQCQVRHYFLSPESGVWSLDGKPRLFLVSENHNDFRSLSFGQSLRLHRPRASITTNNQQQPLLIVSPSMLWAMTLSSYIHKCTFYPLTFAVPPVR